MLHGSEWHTVAVWRRARRQNRCLQTFSRKKASLKLENTSGKGTKDIERLKRDYERYNFIDWVKPFISDRRKQKITNIHEDEDEYDGDFR